jgi:hypothetical protein
MVIMQILKSIYNFLQEFGQVRAAAHFARQGNHDAANRIMMQDFKGWI